MNVLDRMALRQGGAIALVFAVPFSLAARLLADMDPPSPWRYPALLAALAGFVVGGGVAAWVQRTGYPMVHGMVCAAGTYLLAQTVFVVVKLVRGGDINWFGVFFNFTITLFAGVIGGALGSALQKRGFAPGRRRPS
ncbi:MAG: hypothetical protein KDB12_07630 [Ilumatobacter sp.]|nr:hypothetical protein [Ilumatobacter sp.]